MRDFAKDFYSSRAWQETRRAYRKSVGGLCERCYRAGRYKAGEIVHHKIPLTPQNITDPALTLGWNNLELLCRDCHGEVHGSVEKRYTVDNLGRVVCL